MKAPTRAPKVQLRYPRRDQRPRELLSTSVHTWSTTGAPADEHAPAPAPAEAKAHDESLSDNGDAETEAPVGADNLPDAENRQCFTATAPAEAPARTVSIDVSISPEMRAAALIHDWAQTMCELAKRVDDTSNDRREAINDAGGIPPLVGLLKRTIPMATLLLAVEAVSWLALSMRCGHTIRQANGINALADLLYAATYADNRLEEHVVRALVCIAHTLPIHVFTQEFTLACITCNARSFSLVERTRFFF